MQASVSYKVEAEVAVPGLLKPNLYHSQDILICEPLRSVLSSTDLQKETKVTFLCCIPKGSVAMAANIDRNAYGPGDVVNLRLIVDNSSSDVDLQAATLKLVRTLNVRAQTDRHYESLTVVKSKGPGVPAGEKAERIIQLHLPNDSEPSTSSNLIDCSYQLSIELKVPWSPDVTIKVPIQIYAPQRPTYVATLQYPVGWNPNMFPVVNLQNMQYVSY